MTALGARPPVWPVGATRIAAVIGDPVRHSLSPVLHNAAFTALGLDWVYVALPVPAGRGHEAVEAMRVLGIEGLSVTMPHKADVAAALDEVSEDGRLLGAVNTVVRRGDRLTGETTDGAGFVDALREEGCEPAGLRCLVVGAGGAGRAVVLALARAGAKEIVVVNRDPGRAAAAVALAPGVARHGVAADASACGLVVNATPLGMGSGAGDVLPVDAVHLGRGQVVNDLVYHPAETPLLRAATARGATAVNGLGMLLHQAGRQLRLWTGEEPPIPAMRDAIRAELARRG